MKKLLGTILLAAACGAPLRAAPPTPLFAPEPPEPAAAAFVENYLGLLAAGRFDEALLANDLRGMRQYLLDRRLADLKEHNAELTAKDLEDVSVQLQTNELHPLRLQEILRQVMRENGYKGMTWTIRGYAPAPEATGGHLVSVDARTAGNQEKPILVGIKKLGDQWWVAPEAIEELMGNKPVIHAVPRMPPPDAVAALVDAFWKHWQAGTLDEAYELAGPAFRERVSLLAFLQQAQDFMAKAGVPASWTLVQGIETGPGELWLGVNVQGSTALKPTLMQFKKTGETWTVEDVQLEMPRGGGFGIPPSPNAAPLRPDLRPNLQPALPTSDSAPEAVESQAAPPAAGAPVAPVAPVAPESPEVPE